MNETLERFQVRRYFWQYAAAGVGILALLTGFIVVLYVIVENDIFRGIRGGMWIWVVWSLIVMMIYLVTLYRTPEERASSEPLFPNRGLLWLFVALLIFNGMTPYLGLKTETSFTMFSNLRTEGGRNNHLFMPFIPLANYQDDLLEPIESNQADFQREIRFQKLLTRFEFERLLLEIPEDFRVTVVYNGETIEVVKENGVVSGFEIESYSWLLGRFMYFRPIYKGEVMPCTH